MKAGKVWGTTELIEANGALEFHRIEMKKNGSGLKYMETDAMQTFWRLM